jgi:hypothetical protein
VAQGDRSLVASSCNAAAAAAVSALEHG